MPVNYNGHVNEPGGSFEIVVVRLGYCTRAYLHRSFILSSLSRTYGLLRPKDLVSLYKQLLDSAPERGQQNISFSSYLK